MRLNDRYDWIVIGDHPGSLLSGCLAARLGLSVLIVPAAPALAPIATRSGECLDPESNVLIGGLLGQCLDRLGIEPTERVRLESEGVLPQVLAPQARIRLHSEGNVLQSELRRELGETRSEELAFTPALERASVVAEEFWGSLPARLTLDPTRRKAKARARTRGELLRRLARASAPSSGSARSWYARNQSVSAVARALGRSELQNLGAGAWYGIIGTELDDPGLGDLLHALTLARTAGRFRGGIGGYRTFLQRLAVKLGAHVSAEECSRIFVENGRFAGVQITGRGSMIAGSGAVLGCSLREALAVSSFTGSSLFRRMKSGPAAVGWKFTLSLEIRAEALTPGLSRRMVWKETGAPSLEIELADPAEYGADANGGGRLVFLRTMLPYEQRTLEPAYQRLVAARMMRQLSELIPFLEYHVVRVYPDFRVAAPSPFAFGSLDRIPSNLCVHSGSGVGSGSGVDGLFVASGESIPELGSFGPTVAALESTAWIAHRSGLAGPLA